MSRNKVVKKQDDPSPGKGADQHPEPAEVNADALSPAELARPVDLTCYVEQIFLERFQCNPALFRGVLAKRERLIRQLVKLAPTALGDLLVERVVLNYLLANGADLYLTLQDLSPKHLEFRQRYAERMNRRYLNSIKAFAQCVRFLGPNVQVNIAEKQIVLNTGQAADPEAKPK